LAVIDWALPPLHPSVAPLAASSAPRLTGISVSFFIYSRTKSWEHVNTASKEPKPLSAKDNVHVAPAEGKLGILIPGIGAVSTTFIAGVEAIKRGLGLPVGSLT
jgi:hypothetical protein